MNEEGDFSSNSDEEFEVHKRDLSTYISNLAHEDETLQKYNQELQSWISREEKLLKQIQTESLSPMQEGEAEDDIYSLSKEELIERLQFVTQKYTEESTEKKELLNQVIELKGNVRVYCRVRPLLQSEIQQNENSIVEFENDNRISLHLKQYMYDRVFSPFCSQDQVFQVVKPMIVSVLDGHNLCILAYGQTSSGKTYTMEGTSSLPGLSLRTLRELFLIAKEKLNNGGFAFSMQLSLYEIYNDSIRDLLADPKENKKVEIRGNQVENLIKIPIHSLEDVQQIVKKGKANRTVGATNANEHSSRSHLLIAVEILTVNDISQEKTQSQLFLVDLAGSERVAKTMATGTRLKEAQFINKSLAALGNVMAALASKNPHVPFRDSKLTYALQPAFSKNSKVLMFVHISPTQRDLTESTCTLHFGSRVRTIDLGSSSQSNFHSEAASLKHKLKRLQEEMNKKDEIIQKLKHQLLEAEARASKLEQSLQIETDKIRIKSRMAKEEIKKKALEIQELQIRIIALQEKTNSSLASATSASFGKNYGSSQNKENISNLIGNAPTFSPLEMKGNLNQGASATLNNNGRLISKQLKKLDALTTTPAKTSHSISKSSTNSSSGGYLLAPTFENKKKLATLVESQKDSLHSGLSKQIIRSSTLQPPSSTSSSSSISSLSNSFQSNSVFNSPPPPYQNYLKLQFQKLSQE